MRDTSRRQRRVRNCDLPPQSEQSTVSTPDLLDTTAADAKAIFRAAVRRVQADRLLNSTDPDAWAPQPLGHYEGIRVVGLGKAAMAMMGTVEQVLGDAMTDGYAIVPEGYPEHLPASCPAPTMGTVVEGGHPLPTEAGVRGARRIVEQAEAAGADELLLVLVSGGGTALGTLPADGMALADLKRTYHLLLRSGVNIQQMNAVRKHLTQTGGGQLARAAAPADVGSLIVSDVVGNDMSVIASGPTVPDPTTYEDAMRVLYTRDLWTEVSGPVRTRLSTGARGRRPETPGPEADCFERTSNTLVGTNRTALAAAREAAEARGYAVRQEAEEVEGEARSVGKAHVQAMLQAAPDSPTCWLWGGETTVTVTGDGKGGRNQEVALGAALAMEDASRPTVLLSGGTDGIDGPTDAAGAWATPMTTEKARAVDCDPKDHLRQNDAYPFFDAIDHLLRPGPTHTNVMDVHVGLSLPEDPQP
ncbi:hydroxypyruvate reductase [Salinibacter ruber DSM 13855]|uniref:Hydroxypyruvate reductase n=1 Tax=Salinibacter ruber (strain DSM 13855 / M31) TaxID=309807 RepID=Q2S2B0_SALRD|nr:hydroxypyruvate reductase [Salinibacter ruber DSM 13855]